MRVSLDLQDRMIESLRNCVVDDVHVSITIATLLQLLTSSIRERFLRFAPFDRADPAAPSRERTPTSPQTTRDDPHARDYRWQNLPQHQQQQQQQGFNTFPLDNPNPNSAQGDPLANIPAQSINAPNLGVSFMPPPQSAYFAYFDPDTSPKADPSQLDPNNNNNNNTATTTAAPAPTPALNPDPISTAAANGNPNPNPNPNANLGSSSGPMSDWLALPLDQFFNSSTAGVEQGLGGTGPMVGEFDMLEVLLKEQYTGGNGAGPGGGGAGDAVGSGQFLQ